MSKQQFDDKVARDAQSAQIEKERRASQSSMPPRSEWKSDTKPTTFSDVWPKQTVGTKELPPLWHSMKMPPGDKDAEERKRKFFESR
jgi:hypothetical protein